MSEINKGIVLGKEYEKILKEILSASSPYLKRKKGTPRGECRKLNEVHLKCVEFLRMYSDGN